MQSDCTVPLAQSSYVLACLCASPPLRPDGRGFDEPRRATLRLRRYAGGASGCAGSAAQANAEACLGRTQVTAVVTAALGPPGDGRANEGSLSFAVTAGPAAGPQYEVWLAAALRATLPRRRRRRRRLCARPTPRLHPSLFQPSRGTAATAELARLLERAIRDSRALDTEALCVVPGAAVWQLRVDVHALCDDGNLADAAALASIAALAYFRRPDAAARADGSVRVFTAEERAPLPLSLHHTPVAVSTALFSDPRTRARGGGNSGGGGSSAAAAADEEPAASGAYGSEVLLADPTLLEERICDGRLTLIMNAHRELCGMHKLGGCPLEPAALAAAATAAGERAQELVTLLRAAVAEADGEADARDAAALLAATIGAPPPGAIDTELDAVDAAGAAAAAPTVAANA